MLEVLAIPILTHFDIYFNVRHDGKLLTIHVQHRYGKGRSFKIHAQKRLCKDILVKKTVTVLA